MGLGYVGLPLAVRAAEQGHSVIGYDPVLPKIESLQAGQSYIEDISNARLGEIVRDHSFVPISNERYLDEFDVGIITVPTPLKERVPDLSYIEEAAKVLARRMTRGTLVVLESTTYPGTTEEFVTRVIENESGMVAGRDYYLGFSPERIDPGNKTWNFVNTPKIVSGIDDESLDLVRDFYSTICDTVVPVSSPKVAELAKIIENTFRHVNIALVNEMAMFANELDIDIWEAITAANTKPFGFMKFLPGPGAGGHCLPVDAAYLSWRVRTTLNKTFKFIELADDVNSHMPDYVVERASRLLNDHRKPLNGSNVLVLGLAYKPGTSDMRESPSMRVIKLLQEHGALVSVSDPYVRDWEKNPVIYEPEAKASEFDLVIVVTNHSEFDYEKLAKTAELVLDCRRVMPAADNIHYL